MSLPLRDEMFERVMDEVARYYRHSDIVLSEDGHVVRGRLNMDCEHVVRIDINGPRKKVIDGQV
jgi:hypothetical protein